MLGTLYFLQHCLVTSPCSVLNPWFPNGVPEEFLLQHCNTSNTSNYWGFDLLSQNWCDTSQALIDS